MPKAETITNVHGLSPRSPQSVFPTAEIRDLAQHSARRSPTPLTLVTSLSQGGLATTTTTRPKQSECRVPGLSGVVEITYLKTGKRVWFHRYTDPQTRRRNSLRLGAVGVDSMLEMISKLKSVVDALADGRSPTASEMACGVFFDAVYILVAEETKGSYLDDRSRFDLYLRDDLGAIAIGSITEKMLRALIAALRSGVKRSKRRERLSNATINRVVMLIRSIFRLAMELGYIGTNPAERLRASKESPPSPKALDLLDLQKLHAAMVDADWKLVTLVDLQLLCALRVSEAAELLWDDVDLVRGVILLRMTKSGRPQEVQLSAAAIAVLIRAREFRKDGNPFVLPSARGDGPMCVPRKAWNRLLVKAGIEHSGFHILRKSWAFHAMAIPNHAMAGPKIDAFVVSRMLRHQSVRTTERHYLATPHERVRHATQEVGKLFSGAWSASSAEPSTRRTLVPTMRSCVITGLHTHVASRRHP